MEQRSLALPLPISSYKAAVIIFDLFRNMYPVLLLATVGMSLLELFHLQVMPARSFDGVLSPVCIAACIRLFD